MNKLVSIIMPVLNREKTIGKAIESIIRQTYQNWELIIIDDGSKDKTEEVIKKYQKKEERIRLTSNTYKKGVARARNTGIYAARGEYIAFLDSDDEWLPIHLSESMTALEKTGRKFCSALWMEDMFGEISKVGESGWYCEIFDNMKEALGIDRNDTYWLFDERLFSHIIRTDFYCFHINTIVVERELLLKVGGFDVNMKQSEDLDLIYRLLQHALLVTINSYHFIYHYGDDNLYAYTDYSNINIDELICDKTLVQRICRHIEYKIRLTMKVKKIVEKRYKNEKELIETVNSCIYERMMTYAYILKYVNKGKSIVILQRAFKFHAKYCEKDEKICELFANWRKDSLYID